MSIKATLDAHADARNRPDELSYDRPDPLLIARRYHDEFSSLICALFGYGRADAIVKYLDTLDMGLIDADEKAIQKGLANHYYRFQTAIDTTALFIALQRVKRQVSLETVFMQGYKQTGSVLDGVNRTITEIHKAYSFSSRGYNFLVGNPVRRPKGGSTLKRWLMFLRWMVRSDALDMGLWKEVDPADLIIPLDTHTFTVAQQLGLLTRKSYDLQSAIELTEVLKKFDPYDPVRYDFALYRMGQEKVVV